MSASETSSDRAGRVPAVHRGRLWVGMMVVFAIATTAGLLGIGVRATHGGHAAVDEPQYLLTALSLAEDGDLDIADELAQERWRAFFDEELPQQTQVLEDGRQVSPHDPLLPVLIALPMGLGGFLAAKATLALLAGVTAALTLWIAVRRLGVSLPLATVGTGIGFASPPLAVYAQQVYPELPAALAVCVAFAILTGRRTRVGVAGFVAAVSALPWLGVKYVPVAGALVVICLLRLWFARRGKVLVGTLASFAALGAVYLLLHRLIWGGWTVYASGDHFVTTGEFSVVGVSPDYVGRSVRLVGLMVDQAFGIAAWQPAWLLAVPALAALLAARPVGWSGLALPLLIGWLVATFVALTMNGFWWPGRQVVVVLPLALLVVLWWLQRASRGLHVAAVILGVLGVFALGCLLVDGWSGEITWVVHFEGVDDPTYHLRRLLLPDYRAGWSQFWPGHLAWSAVLCLLAVFGWRSMTRRLQTVHEDLTDRESRLDNDRR
ncbi:MAG TPA: hypothetical protein VIL34_04840 [Actinopolymorphaceae bacterium]